jgi:gas vesicle protein
VANRKNAAPADSTREYNFQIKKRGRLMTDYERYGEYQPSERSVLGTGITMLLIGLGAGALTALLLAPRSGKQTRKLIRRKYDDAVEDFSERAEEIRERGSEWLERAKDFAGDVTETAQEARDRVKAFSKEARKRAER